MPDSILIFKDRYTYEDGDIVEMTIWRVPEPVPPGEHFLKYSLFYGRPGLRLLGYDNERGKGDHKHIGQLEHKYTFTIVEVLMADFLKDVEDMRNG